MLIGLILPCGWGLIYSRTGLVVKKILRVIRGELLIAAPAKAGTGMPLVFSGVFIFILLNNFLGLLPYVFTATRHLRITLALSGFLWLSLFLPSVIKTPTLFLSHLVPKGTPVPLVPFMVLIELIRGIIRPFTLGIRLAANMIAGHLLLVLMSSPIYALNRSITMAVLRGLFILRVLEIAVSLIQSYVFMRLGSLYARETRNATII